MIELLEMAKFVNNNVVLIFFRQVDNSIVEIQIALPRATPPPRLLVANGNSGGTEIIY